MVNTSKNWFKTPHHQSNKKDERIILLHLRDLTTLYTKLYTPQSKHPLSRTQTLTKHWKHGSWHSYDYWYKAMQKAKTVPCTKRFGLLVFFRTNVFVRVWRYNNLLSSSMFVFFLGFFSTLIFTLAKHSDLTELAIWHMMMSERTLLESLTFPRGKYVPRIHERGCTNPNNCMPQHYTMMVANQSPMKSTCEPQVDLQCFSILQHCIQRGFGGRPF